MNWEEEGGGDEQTVHFRFKKLQFIGLGSLRVFVCRWNLEDSFSLLCHFGIQKKCTELEGLFEVISDAALKVVIET